MSKNRIRVITAALQGLTGRLVEVECDLQANLPSMMIVGLPDKTVEEAKERVRVAIRASGFRFPRGRVVVNLAPAEVRKHGPLYDLPIAVGILAAQGEFGAKVNWKSALFVGELSLDGELRPVNGVLSVAKLARQQGIMDLFVPAGNADEALLVKGVNVLAFKTLADVAGHLKGTRPAEPAAAVGGGSRLSQNTVGPEVDLGEIYGQAQAKRALTIAMAGGHNLLLIGPPGSGKTMLAKSSRGLLPALDSDELIEVAEIYSAAGLFHGDFLGRSVRPFRSPHHSISSAALVGGGNPIRPGEITLSHLGVLHLDELSEFNRQALESLREPMEDGQITLIRATGRCVFPARFRLLATMNPCPCGYLGDNRGRACRCGPAQVRNHWSKVSGPLLDRIDLFVWVRPTPAGTVVEVSGAAVGVETRAAMRHILAAQVPQQVRGVSNSALSGRRLAREAALPDDAKKLLLAAASALFLSTRACHRVIRVARTIADMEGSEKINASHVGEALQYRLDIDSVAGHAS